MTWRVWVRLHASVEVRNNEGKLGWWCVHCPALALDPAAQLVMPFVRSQAVAAAPAYEAAVQSNHQVAEHPPHLPVEVE